MGHGEGRSKSRRKSKTPEVKLADYGILEPSLQQVDVCESVSRLGLERYKILETYYGHVPCYLACGLRAELSNAPKQLERVFFNTSELQGYLQLREPST